MFRFKSRVMLLRLDSYQCDRPLLGPVALFGQYNSLTEVEINHAFAK